VSDAKKLFNIKSDPEEKQNLYKCSPDIAQSLEGKLRAWKTSLPFYKVKFSFLPNIDKTAQERIKKTGYWYCLPAIKQTVNPI